MKSQQLFKKVYNGYNPELLEREAKKHLLRQEEYTELGFEIWTAFYKNNFHRFIADYFGFKGLKTFQKMLLYQMNENDQFVYIASRGQGSLRRA